MQQMNVTVVGGGRMGLPLACAFGNGGADVTVADIDPALVASIELGQCPYDEPGLADRMTALHACGRLHATIDTSAAASLADVVVVIVPAHLTAERSIDLSILQSASAAVGAGLRKGTLVIYETTVSVGATRRSLVPVLEKHSGLGAGRDFDVGYSPERVKANLVLDRLQSTPKVVGGLDARSCARAVAFYRDFLGAPVEDVGSLEAAEMTKLIGMLYRDVNIALANELATFCELANVNFERVRQAANQDGEADLLLPGIGVGGHCTPVYPYFLTRESRRLGMVQRLSEAAREINDGQPARQLDRIERAWQPLSGKTVHLMGLGFRPGVNVDTLSPAYALRDELLRRGAKVSIEDPYYTDAALRSAGFEPNSAKAGSVVILNTAHPQFASPDFAAWRRWGVQVVLDGRNLWPQEAVEAAGLMYFGVGRASASERNWR
jgi:nucleotide sugar dehydrogenase